MIYVAQFFILENKSTEVSTVIERVLSTAESAFN